MIRLSKYFTLDELTKSQTALRLNIDNRPPDHVVANLGALSNHILEPVRHHFNRAFSPSSGYRCAALNKIIGAKATSRHVLGQAVDFEIPSVANYEVALWIRDNLTFDQLILEYHARGAPYSGWIHCSYHKNINRQQALIFDGNSYHNLQEG